MLCCVRGAGAGEARAELHYERAGLRELPPAVALAGRTLERLTASGNCLTHLPRHLFICRELRLLDLADNDIAELPAAVAELAQLRLLDCSRNSLARLPDELKALKHLAHLDLSCNPLEKLPEPITTLVALRDLFLNDVYLEFLPANFGRLANLRILELRDNYLVALPKSLARSADLARLDIGQNEFSDFPEVIGKFTKLRELWIDCNSLTDLSPEIGNLTELIHFEASNNLIEELPEEIGECKLLVDLSFSSNRLNGLPDSIGNLTNLVSLKLDSNKLYSLPDSIGDLINLEELMLTTNFLAELPRTIGRLKKLQCLNADENILKAIPPEIGNCSSLTVLSLRSNRLTSVPGEIGHLSSLKVLNLVGNSLRCLPQSLLNCAELVALWLSENQSKPLVPMQSEIDPRTRQQVLTCFLFPQIPITEETAAQDIKSYDAEVPVGVRHISFVDVKAAAKGAAEKPGLLRRAPTPYPKELRALAKHARNIQKDGSNDPSLSMQNAVHIKAAKVTPTLQQRFASNHAISGIRNVRNDWYDNEGDRSQLKSDSTYDNSYGPEKPYANPDQALYSESADSAYGGFTDHNNSKQDSDTYVAIHHCNSIEERVNNIIRQSSHDLYAPARKISEKRLSPVALPYENLASGNRNSVSSGASQNNHSLYKSREASLSDHGSTGNGPSIVQSQSAYSIRENPYGHVKNLHYDPTATGEQAVTYAQAKEKIYGRSHSGYGYGDYSPTSYRPPSVDQNLFVEHNQGERDKSYSPNTVRPDVYGYTNDPNVYNDKNAIYNHHKNYVGDGPYESASVSSHHGIYSRDNSSPGYAYNNHETANGAGNVGNLSELRISQEMPTSVSPSKMNPPPYHIAATYSKQAQFFNASN